MSTISQSIWTALINLRQCRNIKAVDSTMFLGLKVVLTLIYKGFRGPVLSFDAPFNKCYFSSSSSTVCIVVWSDGRQGYSKIDFL